MNRQVRFYIEGGADGRHADQDFRRAWRRFLAELHELCRQHSYVGLEVVRCKGRSNAFQRFCSHRITNPHDLGILLVDAEGPARPQQPVWDVVAQREGDRWNRPTGATNEHLYLMVQSLETWIVSDPDALSRFFGRGFDPTHLPQRDLENHAKKDLEKALKRATSETKKGAYRHGHSHEVLEFVSPHKVKVLPSGQRLFESVAQLIVAA